ncbi:hypothetical protein Rrhod_1524 [Rhodococcus rhodnii LMG 5362]|uniref:Uncharacterized protein n=1 Tax=Rhodococcus rhodnii LMG 5362 TaxID=1273125 RepID=R7WSP7_9NOCA|nr:hypothetical protein Rrhod_1524 [Rhodococcus rhodnii LMG 5362]
MVAPRTLGQRGECRPDEQQQEREAQRSHDDDLDEPGRGCRRGDVAVSGRRERGRRVVEGVDERQLVVAVAVAIEVHDRRRDQQDRDRVPDPPADDDGRSRPVLGDVDDSHEGEERSFGELAPWPEADEPRTHTLGQRTPRSSVSHGVDPRSCTGRVASRNLARAVKKPSGTVAAATAR